MSRLNHHRSAEARQYRRLYGTARWRHLREAKLSQDPLCERCLQAEDITPATVVNHRVPHRGDQGLFFKVGNLESVCEPHHNSLIQREEKRGHIIGSDIDGRPIDPNHPWNRSA